MEESVLSKQVTAIANAESTSCMTTCNLMSVCVCGRVYKALGGMPGGGGVSMLGAIVGH